MQLTANQILPLLGVTSWKYRLLESSSGPWLHQVEAPKLLVAIEAKEWENPSVLRLFENWCKALNYTFETVGVLRKGSSTRELKIDVIFGGKEEGLVSRQLQSLSYYLANPQSKRELWLKTLDLKGPKS